MSEDQTAPPGTTAAPTPDERAGIAWWNALTEAERAEWLRRAGSARVVDAWEESLTSAR